MIPTFLRNLFRDLRRQPLRTSLTLSGVIWGTFAVVLLLAFGSAVGKENMKSFRGVGQGFVIAFPVSTTLPYKGLPKGRRVRLTPEQVILAGQKIPGIKRMSFEFTASRRIRHHREEVLNTVRGVTVEYGDIRNIIADKGRYLNDTDMALKRRVCVLGNTIKENLFHDADAVGQTIFIEGIPFLVVGVMRKKIQTSNFSGQFDEHCAFIPWSTYSALYGDKYIGSFIFQPENPAASKPLIRRVREYLGNRAGFSPDDKDALFVWDWTEFEKSFSIFFVAFNVFLGLIGFFTLLVGGVGVASIMLVVVEERTKEIGIKLAVGAKRRHILWQFFAESLAIILIGGGLGFLFAALVLKAIPVEKIQEYVGAPYINPAVGVATILILLTIGIISGTMPARRAASTNPIEALRK
ncbi:MAG: ABC transporter permease [Candidatus Aminicenantes bacterium]|nr:ABC transporter permease [Candidatus Aminicenantes bacterium]MDH5743230.1 ABC transporter permease [Candidatus Aminicenantes bacterium]